VPSLPSEFFINLCFIRSELNDTSEQIRLVGKFREEASLLFPVISSLYIDRKSDEVLEIVVCELNGLSMWETEEELLVHLEEKLSDEWWSWLSGYKVQVFLKRMQGHAR
jgi:hypothetical protein